ncbi:MAG: hypothetical protein R2741_01680 [Methanolobus sp.]
MGESFPETSSNSPTVIVEATENLVTAALEVSTELDSYTVNRKDTIPGVVHIKNTGTAPASGVSVKLEIPKVSSMMVVTLPLS